MRSRVLPMVGSPIMGWLSTHLETFTAPRCMGAKTTTDPSTTSPPEAQTALLVIQGRSRSRLRLARLKFAGRTEWQTRRGELSVHLVQARAERFDSPFLSGF